MQCHTMLFPRVCAAALLALVTLTSTLRAGVLEDRGIEDAIDSSFVFRELLIDRTMVQIYVRYGVVELRGQVVDERERDLLTYFISALPEVTQVDNRLFVDSDNRRDSTRWRALRLRAQLIMLARVEARPSRVEVRGERWQLVSEFHDEASRQAFAASAHELAPDVQLVLTLSDPHLTPLAPFKMDDPSIAAMVRSALSPSSTLTIIEPQVSCTKGKVTLKGYVRTPAEQTLALQLATASRGVLAVDNRLALQP